MHETKNSNRINNFEDPLFIYITYLKYMIS